MLLPIKLDRCLSGPAVAVECLRVISVTEPVFRATRTTVRLSNDVDENRNPPPPGRCALGDMAGRACNTLE